jgi:hypothetical protein
MFHKKESTAGDTPYQISSVWVQPTNQPTRSTYPEDNYQRLLTTWAWALEIEQKLNGELDNNWNHKKNFYHDKSKTRVVSKPSNKDSPALK